MRVVITGVGMVTPLGANTQQTWDSVLAGKNGIHPIKRFDATGFPITFAAEAATVDYGDASHLSAVARDLLLTRKGQLTYIAVQEAMKMAGGPNSRQTRLTETLVMAAAAKINKSRGQALGMGAARHQATCQG